MASMIGRLEISPSTLTVLEDTQQKSTRLLVILDVPPASRGIFTLDSRP